MPIYEYRCRACGHELEKLQKMTDQPLVDCPQCKKPGLTRLISAAGFRLKGTGWYETDFKKGNRRNLAGDRSHGANGESSPQAAGSDSKKGAGSGASTGPAA